MNAPDQHLQNVLSAARAARDRGTAAEERTLIDEALRHAPNDPQALNAAGMRALDDRDMRCAVGYFTQAAAADPGEPALLMNLAAAYRGLGDDMGERANLNAALSIDRLHFMAQLRLAELNQRTGRIADAIQGWRGVLQLSAALKSTPPNLATMLRSGETFLADQTRLVGSTLEARFGATLAAPGAEANRMRACVDHVLGRRGIYHNECAGLHYPFLPPVEFFDRDQFPWLSVLEARAPAIRQEALRLIDAELDAIRPYVRQDPGTPNNKWTGLDHSLDWSACFLWEHGERNDAVCSLCPETAAALEAIPQTRIPGKAPSAFFSILRPGAHIPPHTGVTNTRSIVHLPLIVPENCRFRVGGETRAWREGEAFVFDDTIEHEAWNDSDLARVVLICDVWNPYLGIQEREFLCDFFAVMSEIGAPA